ALRIRERMMKTHHERSASGLLTVVGRTPRRYCSPRAASPHARLLSIGDGGLWRGHHTGGAGLSSCFHFLGRDSRGGRHDAGRHSRPPAAVAQAAAAVGTVFRKSARTAGWEL